MRSMVDDLRSSDAVLTTHVLDMAKGQPGRGLQVELYRITESAPEKILSTATNADGRCDSPLLTRAEATAGLYLLSFDAGRYLGSSPAMAGGTDFFDRITVEFFIADPSCHYHVPLILAPWGYTTYRGAPPERPPSDRGSPSPLSGEEPAAAQATESEAAPTPGSGAAGLTTHVIDIARGCGAAGLRVDVHKLSEDGSEPQLLSRQHTTPEGRTPAWLIEAGRLEPAGYELAFHLGDYFGRPGSASAAMPFFPTARVRFRIADPDTHYHLPLLAAPWGYTTYRGS